MTKSLMWLLDSVLKDISTRCGTDTHRDYQTISRRTEYEGASFLTMTLPDFCRDFERSLDIGQVDPAFFRGFRRKESLPVFLQGLTGLVFDPSDGKLLSEPCEDAIFSIRQLCLMFKKVSLPCSERRERKVLNEYKRLDAELACAVTSVSQENWDDFGCISDVIWSETLSQLSNRIATGDLRPAHGPGATAEKISGNQKYLLRRWTERLNRFFPVDSYGYHISHTFSRDEPLRRVKFDDPGSELPVRVITVPKTLKAPRVIAIEPVCMQYTQQALLSPAVDAIESGPYTSGHVNFRDQGINGELALSSSYNGYLATVDLSEASDRVHKDLVYRMLKSVPLVRDAFFATRSMRAELSDGTSVHLNKFASMGSALCFPVEAMVFFTLCILARLRCANLRPTSRNISRIIKQLSRDVYVYGDDILVPAHEVPVVADVFEDFSLKLNLNKTFCSGKFRESCGMDAFNGVNVTPVYVREMPPCNKQSASGIVSWVSLANQLYDAGWWGSAQKVRDYVESLLRTPLPHVLDTASCLGWTSAFGTYSVERYSKTLHSPEVKGWVVRVSEKDDQLDGYPALMKFFLKKGTKPIFGEHLKRTVRSGSANIKYRWARPC